MFTLEQCRAAWRALRAVLTLRFVIGRKPARRAGDRQATGGTGRPDQSRDRRHHDVTISGNVVTAGRVNSMDNGNHVHDWVDPANRSIPTPPRSLTAVAYAFATTPGWIPLSRASRNAAGRPQPGFRGAAIAARGCRSTKSGRAAAGRTRMASTAAAYLATRNSATRASGMLKCRN